MMKKFLPKFLPMGAAMVALVVGGCSKEDMGTVVGGAAGALAGAQFGKGTGQLAMMAGGTLLGAFLGNSVGKSLDKADTIMHNAPPIMPLNPTHRAMPLPGKTQIQDTQALLFQHVPHKTPQQVSIVENFNKL